MQAIQSIHSNDINNYFKDLTNKANQNDKDMIILLQNEYLLNNDKKQIFDKDLINFYKDNKNKPYSKSYYGKMYVYGNGVKKNISKGIKLLIEAKKMGCEDAYIELILLNLQGIYKEESFKELIKPVKLLNNCMAYNILAIMAKKEGNEEKYLKNLKISKNLGNINALDKLGQYYHDNMNFKRARKYYQQGMKLGDPNAIFDLGVMYRDGHINNVINNDKAIKLFKKASKIGNVEAIVSLGALYAELGNYSEAKKYAKQGVKLGDPIACYNLGQIYFIENDNKMNKKAILVFLKGANLGDFNCINYLNRFGFDANLNPKNVEKVIKDQEAFHENFKHFGAYDGEW